MTASLINVPAEQPAAEQRLRLEGITWQQYEAMVALFMNQFPALRMTYLEGVLELMSTSSEHERLKTMIARLIEAFAEEADIDLNGYGSTTFRSEAAARGLEPDECYTLGILNETPDIAIEVVITSGGLDKLAVYQGLGVQEVWFWENQRFSLYSLINPTAGYNPIATSKLLPRLDLSLLTQFIEPSNQTQSVRAYRRALNDKLNNDNK